MKIYKSNYVWKSANPDHAVMGNPAKSRNYLLAALSTSWPSTNLWSTLDTSVW